MKKKSLLLPVLILLSATLLTMCSKEKTPIQIDQPIKQSLTSGNFDRQLFVDIVASIRKYYNAKNLKDSLNKSDKITYTPDWDHPIVCKSSDTTTHYLFPMIVSAIHSGDRVEAKEVGMKTFLIVKNSTEFYRGAYIYDSKDLANLTPFKLVQRFSGTLEMRNILNAGYIKIPYVNGKASTEFKNAMKQRNMARGGYWQQICTTSTRCTWNNSCDSDPVVVTVTENCTYPDALPSSICREWQLSYDEVIQNCQMYWHEDTPENPGDPGTGEGGIEPVPEWVINYINDIKRNELKPCINNVVNSMIALDMNSVLSGFRTFISGEPPYHWVLKSDGLAGNVNAVTNNYDRNTNTVTTTFNSNVIGPTVTDLSIARTFLHESVHAYLQMYFATNPILANQTYGKMVEEYESYRFNLNDTQHAEFVRSWLDYMSGYLEAYGKATGYNLPSQFYRDLSWGGLQDTKFFFINAEGGSRPYSRRDCS